MKGEYNLLDICHQVMHVHILLSPQKGDLQDLGADLNSILHFSGSGGVKLLWRLKIPCKLVKATSPDWFLVPITYSMGGKG